MKTDKINRLVRDFLHGDMPEEIVTFREVSDGG